MTWSGTKLAVAILGAFLFALPVRAYLACRSFESALDYVEIVALGKVIAIDNDAALGKVVRLEVSETWKGSLDSRYVSFRLQPPLLCCGLASVVGEEALYLLRRGEGQFPFDVHCLGCYGRGRYVLRSIGGDLVLDGLRIGGACGPGESKPCPLETVRNYVKSR